jgi:hypothetical protein
MQNTGLAPAWAAVTALANTVSAPSALTNFMNVSYGSERDFGAIVH